MKPLLKLANALSPSCKQAARLQSEQMDRPLSFTEEVGLRIHLFLCRWCRRYGRQISFLRSAARDCDEHSASDAPHKLSPEARERIKQRLQSGTE